MKSGVILLSLFLLFFIALLFTTSNLVCYAVYAMQPYVCAHIIYILNLTSWT